MADQRTSPAPSGSHEADALKAELLTLTITLQREPDVPFEELDRWRQERAEAFNALSVSARAEIEQFLQSARLQLLTIAAVRGRVEHGAVPRARLVGRRACERLAALHDQVPRSPEDEALYRELLSRRERDLELGMSSILRDLTSKADPAEVDRTTEQWFMIPGDRQLAVTQEILAAAEQEKSRIRRWQERKRLEAEETGRPKLSQAETGARPDEPSSFADEIETGLKLGALLLAAGLVERAGDEAVARKNQDLDSELRAQGHDETWFELTDERAIAKVKSLYPYSTLDYDFERDEIFAALEKTAWGHTLQAQMDSKLSRLNFDTPDILHDDWSRFNDAKEALWIILKTKVPK